MANNVVRINPARIRSLINRTPFFTRLMLLVIVLLYLASLVVVTLPTTGALIPSEISLLATWRLNTFPLVHAGILQTLTSLIALVPLLERFEAEHGTLVSLALFIGPLSTIPGAIYILFDHVIFRANDAIRGASVWVFLLLACESVKQYKANPVFTIADYKIPTWTSAIALILVVNFLIPNTSLLAHLCAALVGYGFELGYLKFLIPPERVLRWIESKLNLLVRLPHYVSVDQKTYGRYGVLDPMSPADGAVTARSFMTGSTQRLGQD